MTDRDGASIRGDFGLPDRASIEFEISWKSKADFVFALGVDDTKSSVKRAFRFEAWAGDLIFQREAEREATWLSCKRSRRAPAVAISRSTSTRERSGSWSFRAGGKQLADLKVRSTNPAALRGLYLCEPPWRCASGMAADRPVGWRDSRLRARSARRTSTAPTARSSMAN